MDQLKNYKNKLESIVSSESYSDSKSTSPVIGQKIKPKELFPKRDTSDKIEGLRVFFPLNCVLTVLIIVLFIFLPLYITYDIYMYESIQPNASVSVVVADYEQHTDVWNQYIEKCCISQNDTYFYSGCQAYDLCEDLIKEIYTDMNKCCFKYGGLESEIKTYCDFICLNTERQKY